MKENGLTPVNRLKNKSDVALTPFGLVSSFEAYVDSPDTRRVARLLVEVPGVELCTLPEEGGWTVFGEGSEARIRHRKFAGKDEWSYQPMQGDPLGYVSLVSRLKGKSTSVWIEDSRWLEASAFSDFPDALYRIARSYDLVENAASVVCSLEPGYMFGALRADYAASS